MTTLALALGPLLAACGGADTVQEALGYTQNGPDELVVVSRPPLVVPPDYNLRPPRPFEAEDGSQTARDAARRTLLGPNADAAGAAQPNSSRALLTGIGKADGDTDVADARPRASEGPSEGQSLLVSRTDRTERDLEALLETRSENRVDGALLRRLLAWTPADRPASAEDAEAAEASAVQVVSRSQTVIEPQPNPDQTSAE